MKYIYDIEILSNFFCVVFKHIDTKERIVFEISSRKNQLKELVQFLRTKNLRLIGFNNLEFDYPIIHYVLTAFPRLYKLDTQRIISEIYNYAQNLINQEKNRTIHNPFIPQLDLYKIHHFDNKAKITSLKQIEFVLRMDDVQDMPYAHNEIIPEEGFDEIIHYCCHDVDATDELYIRSKSQIQLRSDLTKEYGIDLMNCNDPKIGEQIFLHLLSKEMGIPKYELSQLRSKCDKLIFENYILDWIKFKTPDYQKLLMDVKSIITEDTKGSFKGSVTLGDFTIDYGQGGLHGCIEAGVYNAIDNLKITDIDVTSFYPWNSINNKFFPKHLGNYFGDIYTRIYYKRSEYPKGSSNNTGCKLMLNGSFGKMNDEYSFLYDPECLLKITLNGQLLLSMLIEDVYLSVPNVKFLQGNTDGFTIMYDIQYEQLIKDLIKQWEELTSFTMELVDYKSMIIRDVNNYIGIYTNNKVKLKGCFEIPTEWYKDHSMIIVPLALKEYFVNNTPVEDTIKNHSDIFDFCKCARMKGKNKLVARKGYSIINQRLVPNDVRLSKTTRYYVSEGEDSCKLIKVLPMLEKADKLKTYRKKNPAQLDLFHFVEDPAIIIDRESKIESGYNCMVFNKFEQKEIQDYAIDYSYYINECNKIIKTIQN